MKRRLAVYLILAALLTTAAALAVLRSRVPILFRAKTAMERGGQPVVFGVSGPSAGLPAGVRNIFINWQTSCPIDRMREIEAFGALPMITWEPYLTDKKRDLLLPDIASGKYDTYISSFAAAVGTGRLFLRFAHEPNGNWYAWSGAKNGGAEAYIKAFRRVKDIFVKSGAVNVRFVFSMNAEDVPPQPWNRFENYYPGGAYADVIGIDAYNWGKSSLRPWARWKPPGALLTAVYERVCAAFPDKPVFLTETASCGSGGDKAEWTGSLVSSLGWRFPAVKAVVWFNIDKECDWAISPGKQYDSFFGRCGNGRVRCDGAALDWIFSEKRPS